MVKWFQEDVNITIILQEENILPFPDEQYYTINFTAQKNADSHFAKRSMDTMSSVCLFHKLIDSTHFLCPESACSAGILLF